MLKAPDAIHFKNQLVKSSKKSLVKKITKGSRIRLNCPTKQI